MLVDNVQNEIFPWLRKWYQKVSPAIEPTLVNTIDQALAILTEEIVKIGYDRVAVHPDADLMDDIGIDPSDIALLLCTLEDRLGFTFTDDQVETTNTVRELAYAVMAQTCPAST